MHPWELPLVTLYYFFSMVGRQGCKGGTNERSVKDSLGRKTWQTWVSEIHGSYFSSKEGFACASLLSTKYLNISNCKVYFFFYLTRGRSLQIYCRKCSFLKRHLARVRRTSRMSSMSRMSRVTNLSGELPKQSQQNFNSTNSPVEEVAGNFEKDH